MQAQIERQAAYDRDARHYDEQIRNHAVVAVIVAE
jgi:hypothetical protein